LAQKLEADRERDRATAAEQKALTEARKSEQVAMFMTEMLKGVGPSAALGRDTTMLQEILKNTTRRLNDLKEQPAVEAALRTVLGDVYYDLGDYQSAEEMHRATLILRRDMLGNKHVEVARTLSELAEDIRKQGRLDEAEPLFAEALAMQRELLGDDNLAVGVTLFRMGMVHNRRRNGAEAELLLREALAIYRQHPSADNPDRGTNDRRSTAAVLDQLALSLSYQGKYAEAEPIFRECVAVSRQRAPDGSPSVAHALYNLGVILRDQRRYAESEPYLREALEIQRKQLPVGHMDTFGSMYALAATLVACNRGAEAVTIIDEFAGVADGNAERVDAVASLISMRLRYFQKGNDPTGCRTSAEMWERLKRTDAKSLYEAARYRAVTAKLIEMTDRSSEKRERAAAQADRAMAWLKKAVDAGYSDLARLKGDKDFDALRGRTDFRNLLKADSEQALADARDAVRLDPNNPALRGRLKVALQSCAWGLVTDTNPSSHSSRAIALSEEALALAPQDANCWHTLGVARYRADDFDGAIAALHKYRELRSDDAEWSNPFFLAMAHHHLGNKEEARQWFEKGAQWMDAKNKKSETMVRFRNEAAELLGVNATK
jgi:tetratricopeptide (TPR) repeat protein